MGGDPGFISEGACGVHPVKQIHLFFLPFVSFFLLLPLQSQFFSLHSVLVTAQYDVHRFSVTVPFFSHPLDFFSLLTRKLDCSASIYWSD